MYDPNYDQNTYQHEQPQQGNWFQRHKKLSIGAGIAAALIIVGGAVGGTDDSDDNTDNKASASTSETDTPEPAAENNIPDTGGNLNTGELAYLTVLHRHGIEGDDAQALDAGYSVCDMMRQAKADDVPPEVAMMILDSEVDTLSSSQVMTIAGAASGSLCDDVSDWVQQDSEVEVQGA